MPDLRFPAVRALLSSTTDVIGVRIPVAIIAVMGFVFIWVATVLSQAPRIEAALQKTVNDVLSDSGFARVEANISGRDVTLTGSVSSPDAGARASSLAAAVTGVRAVHSTTDVVPLRLPYLIVRRVGDSVLVIAGQLPNPDIAARLLQQVTGSIRHHSLVEDLLVDPEVALPTWAEVVTAVAQEANHLQGLEFEIGAGQVAVGGLLENRSDYTVITHRLGSLLESVGTEFVNRIGIAPRNLDLDVGVVATDQVGAIETGNSSLRDPDVDPTDSDQDNGQGHGATDSSELNPELEKDEEINPAQVEQEALDSDSVALAAVVEESGLPGEEAEAGEVPPGDSDAVAHSNESNAEENAEVADAESQSAVNESAVGLVSVEDETLTLNRCQSRINELLVSNPITFPPSVVEITVDNTTIIKKLSEIIYDCPTFSILIGGHTDSRGSESSNLVLSEQRAASVMEALRALGVEKTRLDARGFGSTIPVATNETSEGRRLNRRIEIILSEPEQG